MEVKAGDAVTGLTLGWMLERYVKLEKENGGASKKAPAGKKAASSGKKAPAEKKSPVKKKTAGKKKK